MRQCDMVMFVVDSSDMERMEEARVELDRVIKIKGTSLPILILANKQDLPGELDNYMSFNLN